MYRVPHYTVTDLAISRDYAPWAVRINKNSNVVVVGSIGADACVWWRGSLTRLPMANLPGQYSDYVRPIAHAFGINNAGQIVGATGLSAWIAGDDNYWRAALWRGGNPEDLGQGEALAINDRGQVLIRSEGRGTYLWQRGHRRRLYGGTGYAFNNQGVVIGSTSEGHSLLWQRRQAKLIDGAIRGQRNDAIDINDKGQVVIVTRSESLQNPAHSYLWEKGKLRELGQFSACAINNCGEVVGDRFLWRQGNLYDLNDLLPREDQDPYLSATAINDRGQIVASATLQGKHHMFLLTPIPTK